MKRHLSSENKLLFLMGFVLGPLVASADDLEWPTTRVTLDAREGKGSAEAHFPFRNPSARTVTIEQVESSCSCTTAHVSALQIAPGGTGEIKAVFNLEGRAGLQIKTITVTTDEVRTEPVVLRLDVAIQPVVRIEPQRIAWRLSGIAEPRYADIIVAEGEKVEIVRVDVPDSRFTVTLLPAADGPNRRLRVLPKDVTAPTNSQIEIVVHVFGTARRYALNAVVFEENLTSTQSK